MILVDAGNVECRDGLQYFATAINISIF
jgi:hypothetical protein